MNKDKPRDALYAQPLTEIVDFRFNEAVADVFPDMIRRSVPGYGTIIGMIGVLAEQYAQVDSHCYDLGCSLGAATLAMRAHIEHPGCRIIAVDNAEAMARRCRANVARDHSGAPVDVVCADIRQVRIERAAMVVLNFTLQFIDPAQRVDILRAIYQGMLPGGCLVLSEKITFDDAEESRFNEAMHVAFKKANGYSDLEISQKRAALEKVLIPETLARHGERLRQAGFGQVYTWFQCFNFASLIAIK